MRAVLAGGFGAVTALGLILVIQGLRGRRMLPTVRRRGDQPIGLRAAASLMAALLMFALTGWAAIAFTAAAVVWWGWRTMLSRHTRGDDIERAKAISAWTMSIRDTLGGSAAVQQALDVTAQVAPSAIRPEMDRFRTRARQMPLPDALELLHRDLDHPAADLLIVALRNVSTQGTEDARPLLNRLATSIESDVRMRQQINAQRSGIKTSMKILAVTIAVGVLIIRFWLKMILAAYETWAGQLWLLFVMGVFALAGLMMARLSRFDVPSRFSARISKAAP